MRKLCSCVKCVRLLSCPLTAPAVPQYQRQLLQWESDSLRVFLAAFLFRTPSAGELVLLCLLPCPQTHTVWRGTPAFLHFLSSVLLCVLWAQLPSNGVRRAQHFLCPPSSAGAAYPVQSSTTSERVFLHPKSIENTAKVFITLSELWTFAGLWRQRQSWEGELCEDVPASAFRHRNLITISPGAISTLGNNFCLPV